MVPLKIGIVLALVTGLVAATGLVFAAGAGGVQAVLPVLPSSTQFDLTGLLQEATLDPACVAGAGTNLDAQGNPQVAHCGGTMKLNGQTIVVPSETIVILPASALTWQELFAQSPTPYTGTATGMALADTPKPYTTYEFQAIGNRVIDPTNSDPTKRDRYIAGLVHVSQQDLNAGAGYINFMDYATGEMRVGGVLGDATTGARVRINDPANSTSGSGGRYGRAMSPDGRFMVDQDNPTIASGTGFPMCFPRTDPFVAIDPLCPETNRPINPTTGAFSTLFTMNNPANLPVGGASDPRLQAPFEVGDYVNYSGTLIADPLPGDSGSAYISAHTIVANVAIYTAPGTNPAYVSIEVGLMGTGGLTVIGATEAANRTRFEGMTTDPTRGIHLYGVDVLPDGSTTDRDWGTISPDVVGGAVPGRWRFRPPCNAFGSGIPAKPIKDCVYGPGNGFLPPTREVRAVIEGLHSQVPGPTATTSANGIYYGQYHAPIGEYIFPENVPGQPIPENNFNTLPFLSPGGYSSFTGVVARQLDPWPSNIVPLAPCVAPVANAGGPYTVASGGTVTLGATSSGTTPTFAWAPLAALSGSLSNANIANPVYTAPVVSTTKVVNVSVTATNACGTNTSATKTITVNPALAPVVNPIAAQTVFSGNPGDPGSFAVTASDPNVPTSQPLTWTVTQTGTPALLNLAIVANGPTGANVTYTAPSNVVAPPKVVTLTITAKNPALLSSTPVTTTVTINPLSAATPPVANAGGPYTVNAGGTVTLAGSATGTSPLTFSWAAPAKGSLSGANTATPVFTAPSLAATTVVTMQLTVTQKIGGVTSTSTASARDHHQCGEQSDARPGGGPIGVLGSRRRALHPHRCGSQHTGPAAIDLQGHPIGACSDERGRDSVDVDLGESELQRPASPSRSDIADGCAVHHHCDRLSRSGLDATDSLGDRQTAGRHRGHHQRGVPHGQAAFDHHRDVERDQRERRPDAPAVPHHDRGHLRSSKSGQHVGQRSQRHLHLDVGWRPTAGHRPGPGRQVEPWRGQRSTCARPRAGVGGRTVSLLLNTTLASSRGDKKQEILTIGRSTASSDRCTISSRFASRSLTCTSAGRALSHD